jgi:hypothetical protein
MIRSVCQGVSRVNCVKGQGVSVKEFRGSGVSTEPRMSRSLIERVSRSAKERSVKECPGSRLSTGSKNVKECLSRSVKGQGCQLSQEVSQFCQGSKDCQGT